MKETILLAPNANNAELLRSLAKYGKSSIGLRIVNSKELASLALIRNGITNSATFLTAREQTSIIYSIISGSKIEYFSSASFADAENIAASLNELRCLVKENETVEIENALAPGQFVEKNLAILRIYRRYLSVLSENNMADRISYIRDAILKCGPIDADFMVLEEFPLAPIDEKLLETVSGGNYSVSSLPCLFGAENTPLRVQEYVSAYGASNEVEEIIGNIYENNIPLDKCTVVVTDTAAYAQRFYDISQTYDIPMTFGCGVPILNTNPARLLKLAMKWQNEGACGYDALHEMVFSPAFSLERIIGIFSDCDHPISALDSALKVAGNLRLGFDKYENAARIETYRGTLESGSTEYSILEKAEALFDILGSGYIGLVKNSAIRKGTAGQLDAAALTTICDSIEAFSEYVADGGPGFYNILQNILSKTVRSENSAEGCLYVCGIINSLSTIREHLFVAGLSADSFPGAPKENYLLLDDDYAGYRDIAPTSENRLRARRNQLDDVLRVFSSLGSSITLCFPNFSHSNLKEINASSAILSYFREEHGRDITDGDFTYAGFFKHTLSPASCLGREYLKRNIYPEVSSLRSDSVKYDLEKAYSPTAIETWFSCRRRFYLRYVLHIPEPDSDDCYTVIDSKTQGIIAHGLMESLRPDTDKADFLSRCSDAFDSFIASRPPIIDRSAEDVKNDFMEMLEYAFDSDPRNEVLASETDVTAEHASGLLVHGYPDRVEVTPDGKYIIVDYKTGSTVNHKQNDIETCIQAVIYAWLIEKTEGYEIDHCEYGYPKKQTVVSCEYNDEVKEKLDRVLTAFMDGLRSGDYSPAVSCDKYCKYAEICRKARKEAPIA